MNSTEAATAAEQETILVVEDEPSVREVVRRILAMQCRYRVLVAKHADEAQEIFSTQTAGVDLLLTDVVMPGRSGPELYARLAEECPSLRVLFMSGYAFDDNLGDAPALSKPFSAEVLLKKVSEVLRGRDPASRVA